MKEKETKKFVIAGEMIDVSGSEAALKLFTQQVGGNTYFAEVKSEHSQQYPKGIISFKQVTDTKTIMDIEDKSPDESRYQKFVRRNIEKGNPIHSVVNSSEETLTVGMETNKGGIISFSIDPNGSLCCDTGRRNWLWSIDYVHPAAPVFRTEDGYELKDCEFYTVVNKSDLSTNVLRYIKGADNEKQYFEVYYWFQNKSNAEAFVKDNKPQFSRKDILGAAINDYKTPNQLYITVDKSKLGL